MNTFKRPHSEPAAVETTHGIRRRTVARGAVWAAPVAMVAVSAPAFAASRSCLTAKWTEAVYSGANGKWSFCFEFFNCGTADITVTRIDVYTTYHSPATNTLANQPVHSFTENTKVGANATVSPVTCCTDKTPFTTPPKNGTDNLLPDYYNHYPTIIEGEKIACVAKNGPPVFPANPLYPDSCKRLRADDTYVMITYTISGGTQTLWVGMDDNVGCRVDAGCS